MKKLLVIFLILIHSIVVLADAPKYLIIFSDKTEAKCYILNNDAISKRIQLQEQNDVRQQWFSYHQIQAIIDLQSQKDVTNEFIRTSPTRFQKVESEMSPGNIVLVSVAATILILLFLSALASD